MYTLLLVSALLSSAFGALELIGWYGSGEETPIMAVLSIILSAVLVLTALRYGSPSAKTAQYIWESGDHLAPVAEVRGTDVKVLLAVPLVTVVMFVIAPYLFESVPLLVFVGVGVLVSAALMVGGIRTRVMIQNDCMLVGVPSSPMMLRFPFDKMSSIQLRGRVLKVVMTETINPFSPKEMRYLILGSPRPLAAAIQTVGVVHGVSSGVENVEVDPELLKSCMNSIRHQEDEARREYGDRTVTVNLPPASKTSHYPGIISHLLIFAGISTLLFALVLSILSASIAESIGTHFVQLECCVMLEFIFGFLIIAGAVMAHRRRRYGLVRASAILAIVSIGGFISTILGIVSLILLMKSAEEFED